MPIHSALITEAGHQYLAPLGLIQKGRSRLWVDDHDWWLINVEFQPSGFAKGSYLNVGVQWLWRRFPAHAFEICAPGKPWLRFESKAQFAAGAERLATTAAERVTDFRERFSGLKAVADHYLRQPSDLADALYHGALALGLLGRRREAAARFSGFLAIHDDRDWFAEWKTETQALAVLLEDPPVFRGAVEAVITDTRAALKLPIIHSFPDLHG